MNLIKTAEGGHWYTKQGAACHDADLRIARKALLYPSVTTVDKAVFKNEFLDKWLRDQILLAAGDNPRMPHQSTKDYAQYIYDISMEKSRGAMSFGTELHDACEHYPQIPLNPSLLPHFNAFEGWWKSTRIEPVKRESVFLDHDLGVAGRGDLVCKVGGVSRVVDYKTQDVKVDAKGKKKPAFYDSWVRQLAFYAGCEAKETGLWPNLPQCESVIIDSNPEAGVYSKVWEPEEVMDAYRRFTVGAWLWFDDRDYWPSGQRWDPIFSIPQPIQ
jgi:hypothetical protein